VSCAVALAVMDVIKKENLIENSRIVGQYWMDRINNLKSKFDIIGDVR